MRGVPVVFIVEAAGFLEHAGELFAARAEDRWRRPDEGWHGTARSHITTLMDALETELRRANMVQRERIDGLMEQFSDTNVTLYNHYKNARKLIDLGGGVVGALRLRATRRHLLHKWAAASRGIPVGLF